MVRQVAAALDAAHAIEAIPRDNQTGPHPAYCDDFACLVDFGLANAATDEKPVAKFDHFCPDGTRTVERLLK